MNDYLRRLERLEEQLGPRRCVEPCVKCALARIGTGQDPREVCDHHPQTLEELLVTLPPPSGIHPTGKR